MPADMSSIDPDDLIERLLENQLSDAEKVEFLALLRNDPQLRNRFSTHLQISEAISRLQPQRQDENFIRNIVDHVIAIESGSEEAFVHDLTRRIVRKNWTRRAAIAAMITLAATGSFFAWQYFPDSPPVAFMMQIDESGNIVSNRGIPKGFKHSPSSGLYRLNFINGAVVAIEGPADFAIESGTRLRLHSGRLNAWCPESAHGFQVATATGTVTDLGTSFGVSASADGSSDFLVLDGLIEVSRKGETRRLDEGKAVRTEHGSRIRELEFEPIAFQRTWPLASGILATTGEVRPAPPGTAQQLSQLEDDQSVFVIPEKRNVPFTEPLFAELAEPGVFSKVNADQLNQLEPDPSKRLRSFLVRYNPKDSNDFKQFRGSVTFDRSILAICCQSKFLEATDALFANGTYDDASETARKFRGVDLDQPEKFADDIELSEDRRTVRISFHAGVSSDDIRVILAEE
jgi:hypothetical protein